MKRLILAAALCLVAASVLSPAGADEDTYLPVGTPSVGVHRAAGLCAQTLGWPQNGTDTPDAFKQCMVGQGWRFAYTTYPDPDNPGLACRDFTIFGVVGSSCSNF